MAIISKEKIYLHNSEEFIKVIKYSKGKFSIALPRAMCIDLAIDTDATVESDTEIKVNSLFDIKMKEWKQAETLIERVIMFRAKFNGALSTDQYRERSQNGKYVPQYAKHGYINDESMFQFCEGGYDSSLGMTIQWAVYEKITVYDKVRYNFISGRGFDIGIHAPSNATIIEWNAERELFFMNLDESFANMINMAYKGLGNLTTDKLKALADSGIKLLG